MYNRSIKMFDEPHSPEILEREISNKSINKGKFLTEAHAESYHLSMQLIRSVKPKNVLEIGPGEGYIARNLNTLGISWDTLDFNGIYKPTIQADFSKFDPSGYGEKYDITCAFQVLEHFPFEKFPDLLRKLAFMSSKYVLISIPYSCYGFRIKLRLHKGQHPVLNRSLSFYWATGLKNRKYRKEFMEEFPWAVHYWEIGRKGFMLSKVLNTIESCGLVINQKLHGPNPFHYYVLCEKKK